MLEKIQSLKEVRGEIGEDSFRINVATIVAKYHTDRLKARGIKRSRASVVNVVNMMLKSMDVEKISYGFIRKFY